MMTVMKAVLVASPAMLRHLEGERMFQRIQSLLEMSGSDGNSLWSQPYLDISPKYLLAPWLDGKPEPANSVREAVQAFLLARLGDPWSSAKRWSLAGEDAQDLMKKWLTQVSLKIFFKLIREHALDSHWHYREAFWTAYLEHGAISEAWLVLGSDTRAAATSIKDLNKAYGFLQRADSSQSVLLLRVGSLVLCEWSHSGALRAWPANNKSAPKLRQRNYEASDLRSVSLPFPPDYPSGSKGTDGQKGLPHHGADRGYWQYSVARLIGEHTNIRLTAEDWMP